MCGFVIFSGKSFSHGASVEPSNPAMQVLAESFEKVETCRFSLGENGDFTLLNFLSLKCRGNHINEYLSSNVLVWKERK